MDASAFWLYPDWGDDLKSPFWMRPPRDPLEGYSEGGVVTNGLAGCIYYNCTVQRNVTHAFVVGDVMHERYT